MRSIRPIGRRGKADGRDRRDPDRHPAVRRPQQRLERHPAAARTHRAPDRRAAGRLGRGRRRFRRPGRRPAPGRNSGFAIDLPHNVGNSLDELEGSQRYIGLSRAGIASLEGSVRKHGIACDWSLRGKYHAAVSGQARRDVLEPYAKELEALGEPYRWLEKAELSREIG